MGWSWFLGLSLLGIRLELGVQRSDRYCWESSCNLGYKHQKSGIRFQTAFLHLLEGSLKGGCSRRLVRQRNVQREALSDRPTEMWGEEALSGVTFTRSPPPANVIPLQSHAPRDTAKQGVKAA